MALCRPDGELQRTRSGPLEATAARTAPLMGSKNVCEFQRPRRNAQTFLRTRLQHAPLLWPQRPVELQFRRKLSVEDPASGRRSSLRWPPMNQRKPVMAQSTVSKAVIMSSGSAPGELLQGAGTTRIVLAEQNASSMRLGPWRPS